MSDTTETAADVPSRSVGDEGPALTVVHHPDPSFVGAYQALTARHYDLGRESNALFPGLFDHKRISRSHARLSLDGDRLTVRDEGSRNGTFVNGQRVEERTVVDGDTLRLGPVVLLVHRGPRHYDEPESELFAGTSHTLGKLIAALDAAGSSSQPVTLLGETGVGKELAARLVHETSRRDGPFVPVNCGAMADGVMTSQLFGHTRGAFSGAEETRRGLVEEAEGGTLFLDEIGSASPALQATLLRLLENQEYRVVGESTLRRADVRFVAAAHPEVPATLGEHGLRQDLWFRLAHHVVEVPPLRTHPEDIPALVRRHLGERDLELTPELVESLVRHPWPGNVRELFAAVDRWAASPDGAWAPTAPTAPTPADESAAPKTKRPPRDELLAHLRTHRGSVSAVAKAHRVSRKSVYRWVETFGIDLDTLRDEGR